MILDGHSGSGYLLHEWLHQVDDAYNNLSGFEGVNLPAAGDEDGHPHTWFPDPDQCEDDPDWKDYGTGGCSNVDDFYEHILREHWDRKRNFVASYCKNGVQDYGETDIDKGGDCDIGNDYVPSSRKLLLASENKLPEPRVFPSPGGD